MDVAVNSGSFNSRQSAELSYPGAVPGTSPEAGCDVAPEMSKACVPLSSRLQRAPRRDSVGVHLFIYFPKNVSRKGLTFSFQEVLHPTHL